MCFFSRCYTNSFRIFLFVCFIQMQFIFKNKKIFIFKWYCWCVWPCIIFFLCMSLFVNFICVYLLSHKVFKLWIYLLLILINKLSKHNQMKVLFCMIEYLDLYFFLILSIFILIIVNNFMINEIFFSLPTELKTLCLDVALENITACIPHINWQTNFQQQYSAGIGKYQQNM
jgi:hypothetical protein